MTACCSTYLSQGLICLKFFFSYPWSIYSIQDLAASLHHFTKLICIVLKAQQQNKQHVYFKHQIKHDKMIKTEYNFSASSFCMSCCPTSHDLVSISAALCWSPTYTEISLVEKTAEQTVTIYWTSYMFPVALNVLHHTAFYLSVCMQTNYIVPR